MPNSSALHNHWQFPNPEYHQFVDGLADQITQLSAHLDAGTCQLLTLIAKFDENKGWNGEIMDPQMAVAALLALE